MRAVNTANWYAPFQIVGSTYTTALWVNANDSHCGCFQLRSSDWNWQATLVESLGYTSPSWTWWAMEIVPGTGATAQVRVWLKNGTGGTVTAFFAATTVSNLDTVSAIAVGDTWTGESAPCCANLVKVYTKFATTPTLAELEAIAQLTAPDTTAYSDVLASYENSAANLADRSGNGHDFLSRIGSTSNVGTIAQGLAGPLDTSTSTTYTIPLAETDNVGEANAATETATAPVGETVSDGESIATSSGSASGLNEADTVDESLAAGKVSAAGINEAAGVAEGVATAQANVQGVSETDSISEAITGTFISGSTKVIAVTSPPRDNAAAPSEASLDIVNDTRTTRHPYIQSSTTFSPSATVQAGSLPSGGGVRFDLTNVGTSQTTTLYATGGSGPFSVNFTNLPLGNYTLDTYVVDSAHNVQSGANNHDQVTGIGIGWIIIMIGDSIVAGWDSVASSDPVVSAWTDSGAITSADGRNFQMEDVINSGHYWRGSLNALNDSLASRRGHPVLVVNRGYSGATFPQILARMQAASWRSRIAALSPTHFLIEGGGNDSFQDYCEAPEYRTRVLAIINEISTQYGTPANRIYLSKTSTLPNDQPVPGAYREGCDARCASYGQPVGNPVDDLVSNGYCVLGINYYTHFVVHPEQLCQANDCHPSVAVGYPAAGVLWADSLSPSSVYTQPLAETNGVSESVTSAQAIAQGVGESGGVSETTGVAQSHVQGVSETGNIFDASGTTQANVQGVGESGGVAESGSAGTITAQAVGETVSVAEAQTVGALLASLLVEAISKGENIGTVARWLQDLTEADSVGDGISTGGTTTYNADLAEALGLAESAAATARAIAGLSDADSVAEVFAHAVTLVASLAEQHNLTEDQTTKVSSALGLAEQIASVDGVTGGLAFVASVLEACATAESTAATTIAVQQLSDNAGVIEALAVLRSAEQALSDAVAEIESATAGHAEAVDLLDALWVAEATQAAQQATVGLAEAVAVAEETGALGGTTRAFGVVLLFPTSRTDGFLVFPVNRA